ncbi:MAG TPA: hypothetical protein VGI70_14000, partial [Polyangiales bacterium]
MFTSSHRVRVAALWISAMIAACQTEKVAENAGNQGSHAGAPAPAIDTSQGRASLAVLPLGRIISRDAFGRGRLLLGPALTSALLPSAMNGEQAARLHLSRNAHLLGLSSAAMQEAPLQATHALAGGAQLLQFGQRAGGVEVLGARA